VTVRFVLSQGNRRVAVIPDAPLRPSQAYTLVASGLRDVHGATVTVPDTRSPRAATRPSYDIDRLTFSFPTSRGWCRAATPAPSRPAAIC
jgi:hypothetical protein